MRRSVHASNATLQVLRNVGRRRAALLLVLAVLIVGTLHLFPFSIFEGAVEELPWEPPPPIIPTSLPLRTSSQELSLDEIRAITSRAQGFFARDFSLHLGWNNMKFILDAAVIQADTLNRTAVLPSFVYARACERPIDICAEHLPMVNRGDALQKDEWRKRPHDEQMGWKLPLELMINLPKLRERHSVLLVSEYLRLHGLSPTLETSTGRWDREAYHRGALHPSLFVLEDTLDPAGLLLVNSVPEEDNIPHRTDLVAKLEQIGKQHYASRVPWGVITASFGKFKSDKQLEADLWANGWAVVHSFITLPPQDLFKVPVHPTRQAVPRSKLRGWAEYYGEATESVFLYAGETHLSRKPGGMWFTSATAREDFARLVLHDMGYRDEVREFARILEARMREKVHGRMFLSAHMRRGDFATLGWAMNPSLQKHLDELRFYFTDARRILRTIRRGTEHDLYIYNVPDVDPDIGILTRNLPRSGDPFFLMTDERSPEGLALLRENGAILVHDLLLPSDHDMFGWPLLFTDVLALVEQTLAAQSDYFVGQAFSSVASGVAGIRAATGKDPRAAYLIGIPELGR